MACIGEGIERFQAYPLPQDQAIETSLRHWPLQEPVLGPEHWVLFHPAQYRQPGFPFLPFTVDTMCRGVCFRDAFSGLTLWVPEEFRCGLPGDVHLYKEEHANADAQSASPDAF